MDQAGSLRPADADDREIKKERDMRKITSTSFAFGALLVAAAPALADDQQLAATLAAQRGARHLHVSEEAYRGFAQSEGYTQETCSYIGGPKTGTWAWACR
jgi:hypothetical protein